MADITVTAASVDPYDDSTPVYYDGIAGATLTAGQVVYRDSTDANKCKLAQNDGTLAESKAYGITLHGAASGQPIRLQTAGDINPGGTVTVGEIYLVSATAGGIAPEADVGQGKYVSLIGIGITASKLRLKFLNSEVQVP